MYLIFYSIQATHVVSHEQTYAHIDIPWKESIITIIILSTFLVTFGFVARKLKHITHTHTRDAYDDDDVYGSSCGCKGA